VTSLSDYRSIIDNNDVDDMLLLRVDRAFQFNNNLQPACLPSGPPRLGARMTTAGWGATDTAGNGPVERFMKTVRA